MFLTMVIFGLNIVLPGFPTTLDTFREYKELFENLTNWGKLTYWDLDCIFQVIMITFAWNLRSVERLVCQLVRCFPLPMFYSVPLALSSKACFAHIPTKLLVLFSDLCSDNCPLCLTAQDMWQVELGRPVKDIQSCCLLRIWVPSGVCFTQFLHPGNVRAGL